MSPARSLQGRTQRDPTRRGPSPHRTLSRAGGRGMEPPPRTGVPDKPPRLLSPPHPGPTHLPSPQGSVLSRPARKPPALAPQTHRQVPRTGTVPRVLPGSSGRCRRRSLLFCGGRRHRLPARTRPARRRGEGAAPAPRPLGTASLSSPLLLRIIITAAGISFYFHHFWGADDEGPSALCCPPEPAHLPKGALGFLPPCPSHAASPK